MPYFLHSLVTVSQNADPITSERICSQKRKLEIKVFNTNQNCNSILAGGYSIHILQEATQGLLIEIHKSVFSFWCLVQISFMTKSAVQHFKCDHAHSASENSVGM